MVKALFALLFLVFPVVHAFVRIVVVPQQCPVSTCCSLKATNRFVETTQVLVSVPLEEVTSNVEVTLQAAQKAVKAEKWQTTILGTSSQDLQVLQEEIDNALLAAKQAIQDSEQEEEEDLFDADKMLGEIEKLNVIELLSEGLLDSQSFQELVKQRNEQALLLRQQQVERARFSLETYLKEAHHLKQQIQQAKIRRIYLERFRESISIGIDGLTVGCVIGLYAWHAIPQYLGDNVAPVIPTLVTGGVMGCASIVAATSNTTMGNTIRKKQATTPLDDDASSSRTKLLWTSTIGMDGAMVGCAIAWHAIPQYYLGDNNVEARIVPALVMGGVMGCASIVAATLDNNTVLANIIQKVPLGMASRTILWGISSLAKAMAEAIYKTGQIIAAVPANVASAVLVVEYKVKENSNSSQADGHERK